MFGGAERPKPVSHGLSAGSGAKEDGLNPLHTGVVDLRRHGGLRESYHIRYILDRDLCRDYENSGYWGTGGERHPSGAEEAAEKALWNSIFSADSRQGLKRLLKKGDIRKKAAKSIPQGLKPR